MVSGIERPPEGAAGNGGRGAASCKIPAVEVCQFFHLTENGVVKILYIRGEFSTHGVWIRVWIMWRTLGNTGFFPGGRGVENCVKKVHKL
jgi:hypothetical protein